MAGRMVFHIYSIFAMFWMTTRFEQQSKLVAWRLSRNRIFTDRNSIQFQAAEAGLADQGTALIRSVLVIVGVRKLPNIESLPNTFPERLAAHRPRFWMGWWLASAVLLSACGGVKLTKNETTPVMMHALTLPVIILGDTQEHEIGGLPLLATSGAVDRKKEVTSRPAYHALFGRKLFEHTVMQEAAKPEDPLPVIHLGDVLDVSCTTERARLDEIFMRIRKAGIPLVVVPGNHDGYFQGVVNPNDEGRRTLLGSRGWDYACRTSIDGIHQKEVRGGGSSNEEPFDKRLTKDNVVRWLFEVNTGCELNATTVGELEFREGQCPDVSIGSEMRPVKPTGLHLVLARALIVPWANTNSKTQDCKTGRFDCSYLLQLVQLPQAPGETRKVFVLILDTTQPEREYGVSSTFSGTSLGNRGHVQESQLREAREVLRDQKVVSNSDIVLLAGHHDWDTLSQESKSGVANLLATRQQPAIYLSAHTHEGFWKRHRIVGGRQLMEINVSSLADWPVAHRQLLVSSSDDGKTVRIHAGNLGPPHSSLEAQQVPRQAISEQWETHCSEIVGGKWSELKAEIEGEVSDTRNGRTRIHNLFSWLVSSIAGDKDYKDKLSELASARRIACKLSEIKDGEIGAQFQSLFDEALVRDWPKAMGTQSDTCAYPQPWTLKEICSTNNSESEWCYGCENSKNAGNICPAQEDNTPEKSFVHLSTQLSLKLFCVKDGRYLDSKLYENLAEQSETRKRRWWYSVVLNAAQDAVSKMTDPVQVKLFACLKAYSAFADRMMQSEQGRRVLSPVWLRDEPSTFYVDVADVGVD